MDAEFINAYVQKQKDVINDLMTKIVMSETRVSVAENKLTLVPELNQQITSLQETNTQLMVTLAEKNEDIKRHQQTINDLTIQKEKLKKELGEIRSTVKQISG